MRFATLYRVKEEPVKKCSGIAAVAILALASSVWAQSDPLIGTWKLNLSKSIYDPGPPPKTHRVVPHPLSRGCARQATALP